MDYGCTRSASSTNPGMAMSAATGSGSGIIGIRRIEAPRSSRVGISRGLYGGLRYSCCEGVDQCGDAGVE